MTRILSYTSDQYAQDISCIEGYAGDPKTEKNSTYRLVTDIYGFHQGASPVRKSVSVHGLRTILLSALVSTGAMVLQGPHQVA